MEFNEQRNKIISQYGDITCDINLTELGAVTGAATAKKDIMDNASSQTTTTHNYTLYINVNSLQEPTIALAIGKDTSKAQKLAGLLNIIIERNNIQKQ